MRSETVLKVQNLMHLQDFKATWKFRRNNLFFRSGLDMIQLQNAQQIGYWKHGIKRKKIKLLPGRSSKKEVKMGFFQKLFGSDDPYASDFKKKAQEIRFKYEKQNEDIISSLNQAAELIYSENEGSKVDKDKVVEMLSKLTAFKYAL